MHDPPLTRTTTTITAFLKIYFFGFERKMFFLVSGVCVCVCVRVEIHTIFPFLAVYVEK